MDIFTCKDINGETVDIDYSVLMKEFSSGGLTMYGMKLKEIAELRKQYMLKGGIMPITKERIIKVFEKDKIYTLIEKVLRDCHSKISLYNEASQKYLGGVEATRLLSNIEETISILQDKKEGG